MYSLAWVARSATPGKESGTSREAICEKEVSIESKRDNNSVVAVSELGSMALMEESKILIFSKN